MKPYREALVLFWSLNKVWCTDHHVMLLSHKSYPEVIAYAI